jgi:hypothetical protein
MAITTNCNCPSPPGGAVSCEPGQTAFCYVDDNGKLSAGCRGTPGPVQNALNTGNQPAVIRDWIAQVIIEATRVPPHLRERITSVVISHPQVRSAVPVRGQSLQFELLSGAKIAVTLPVAQGEIRPL